MAAVIFCHFYRDLLFSLDMGYVRVPTATVPGAHGLNVGSRPALKKSAVMHALRKSKMTQRCM